VFAHAPGFGLSAAPGLPSQTADHVVHGIAERETYLIRHCVAGLWTAVSVAAELFPGWWIDYAGGSFGGGLGALMLPWEPRVRRASLIVPTFGNHPVRLALPSTGSGEAVRRHHQRQPAVADVLAYYDAATAAACCHTPVLVAPACFDPAVIPPGQWSVANAFAGPHEIFRYTAGHHSIPGLTEREDQAYRAAHRRFHGWGI
jgi:cephalosporin-C deacetylase